MKFVIICLAFAFAMPANAANAPCYGKAEKRLAQELLRTVPYLGMSLDLQKRAAMRVRNETCFVIAQTGRVESVDYSYEFFGDARNKAIWMAAERRHLDPLKVQAAIVDLYWPPKTI
jgi:hypothetical protein